MRVKPVNPAAVIRDPFTMRALPPEGDEVPESTFWVRRLLDGDVVRVDAPTETAAPPAGTEPVAPLTTRGGK